MTWTIGQKKEFGTYNANMIFDEKGESILMVFGIAQNYMLEELGERDAEGLAIARQVVNDHARITELATENARLTAAHEMQGESLVVLPRWMVSNMADKTEAINAALEDVKYYVGNPSAWEHYDDGVSEKIRAILKAAGMA